MSAAEEENDESFIEGSKNAYSVSLACAWAARTASSPVPGALEGYVSQAHIKHAVRNIHLSGAVRLRVSQNYRHLHLSGAVRLRVSQNYRHLVYRRQ